MKRFIISLATSLILFALNAQEHLSFKGIPIEGSMTSFCQKLKAKGFTQTYAQDNVRLFSGNFTGREATIGVVSTDNGKNVFAVSVLLPASGEWNQLVQTYDYFKNLYIRKYGQPYLHKEYNPASSDSNISLMAEVYHGTVVYGSIWKVEGGEIELSIEKSATGVYEGQVTIRYRDSKNFEAQRQNALDEI